MTSSLRRRNGAKREGGVAMVEFAIVLPVVLLIVFGVTELGVALMRYNTLTKSVQDGARHASAYALLGSAGSVYVDSDLASEIRNLVVYGNEQGRGSPLLVGLETSQVQISIPSTQEVLVAVAFPYAPIFGLSLPTFGFGSSPNVGVVLRAGVRMRVL